jgi:hypothetical protein
MVLDQVQQHKQPTNFLEMVQRLQEQAHQVVCNLVVYLVVVVQEAEALVAHGLFFLFMGRRHLQGVLEARLELAAQVIQRVLQLMVRRVVMERMEQVA